MCMHLSSSKRQDVNKMIHETAHEQYPDWIVSMKGVRGTIEHFFTFSICVNPQGVQSIFYTVILHFSSTNVSLCFIITA